MKTYRPWEPDRIYLLPPSTRDWLPDGHLALFVLDVVGELDLSAIEARVQDKDPRGEKPYAPRMLVALLLYGYCSGIFSSRGLQKATWSDVGARVIAAEAHPHFTTINQFRLDHLEALSGLFLQVLRLCDRAGMIDLGHVAIDGTRIQANASKHKAMSYDRMQQTEARLKSEVASLLERAAQADREDDARFGPDNDGSTLPDELKRRETRLKRLQAAKAALEAEAKAARALALQEQAERARSDAARTEDPREKQRLERQGDRREQASKAIAGDSPATLPGQHDGMPFHRPQHEVDGTPKPKAQRNFTDPDSRIMGVGAGGYVQAYNGQIAVDEKHQIVVAQLLTNQSPDVEHLKPVLEQVTENLGRAPTACTGDAGFWSPQNSQYCEARGIDAHISTRRRPSDPADEAPPSPTARGSDAIAMQQKIETAPGKQVYAKRKWTVEPVFGEIKEVRGFRRFSLRGLAKVRAEFSLVNTSHNLLKLWRHGPDRCE